jgi:hypothetical protein
VDGDEFYRLVEGGEGVFNGLLAGVAADDEADGFGEGLLVEEGLEAGDVVAAEGDDDLGDDGALGELADRVHEDGGSFEHEELFPTVDRVRLRLHHAGAEAGRRKDNCYFHGQGSLV